MNTQRNKKPLALTIVGIAVTVLLIIAIVAVLLLSAMFKNSNSAPGIFGWSVYIMDGEGMSPAIPDGSAVFAKQGVLPEVGMGQVVLCKVVDGAKTTLMRVVGGEADENGVMQYWVRFDNSEPNSAQLINTDAIIGEGQFVSVGWGKFITFATSKQGLLFIVILPCVLLIAYQVVMIILKMGKKDSEYEYSDEIEIIEDEYEENVIEPVDQIPPGEHFVPRREQDRKRKVEKDYEELAHGFGTHMFDSQYQQKKITPVTFEDFLADAPVKTAPQPAPKPQIDLAPEVPVRQAREPSKPIELKTEKAEPQKPVKIVKVKPVKHAEPQPVDHAPIARQEKPVEVRAPRTETVQHTPAVRPVQPQSIIPDERPEQPTVKKKSTNQTLEELMLMLEKQRKDKENK